MTTATVPTTAPAAAGPEPQATNPPDRRRVRIALGVLLLGTAVLYLWGLSASGWANAFYSAAAQAGADNWTAFLFGSSDLANSITVDKPPASIWVMALSVKAFGLSSWSILVPQALMGVGAVALLYLTVRRWYGDAAGLIAGAVLALTPVAVLMFRFNNPDALLVLLLAAAAYCVTRAVEVASWRWLMLAGAAIGFAFLTKSLQAFLVLPGMVAAYAWAAPAGIGRRIRDLALAGVAVVLSAGWWIALVELWPADSRPYIGGSQTDSAWELIWGYNGLGRITGDEVGSVGGGGAGPGGAAGRMWGETGAGRMFDGSWAGGIAWLLLAAAALLIAAAVLTRHRPRTDRQRAGLVLWGGWLLVTWATFSFASGIIHEYYAVALAPPIAALVAAGATMLWHDDRMTWRAVLAVVLALTGLYGAWLLGRAGGSYLLLGVLVGGVAVAAALAVVAVDGPRRTWVAAVALAAVLAGPLAFSVQTAATAHTGSLPTAGPQVAGTRSGPGGGGPLGAPFAGQNGTATDGSPGGAGGLLDASAPSDELVRALTQDAAEYTWIAATIGSQNGAGYQLATGYSVMPIGGFNGSDPAPTLAEFRQYVADGEIHWFIASGAGGGMGPGGAGSSEISTWVQENFTSTTVGGVTLYDLSSGAEASAAAAESA